jgi:hypothetical protein
MGCLIKLMTGMHLSFLFKMFHCWLSGPEKAGVGGSIPSLATTLT